MSRQRKIIEADPELVAEMARRRAHIQGYEDGMWKRPRNEPGGDDDPRSLAYLIGYARGLKARAEVVVTIKGKVAPPGPWDFDDDPD